MTKKRPSWGAYEKNWTRFVLTYRLGASGKASRRVAYKKAKYLDGYMICKPFRKE